MQYDDINKCYIIENSEEFDKYNFIRDKDIIKYSCSKCGKENVITSFRKNRIKDYKMMLCTECKREKTSMELYGYHTPFAVKEYQNKAKESLIKNIGYDNPFKSPEIVKEIKQNNLKRFGTEYPMQSDIIQNKVINTCFNNLGVKRPFQNKEIMNKAFNVLISKYGTTSPILDPIVKKKREDTLEKRTGYRTSFGNPKTYAKRNETIEDLYGDISSFNYTYNFYGMRFHSFWELAFYLYHVFLNIPIIREPCYFEYEYEGKLHKYYPDFLVNEVYYEIKGDQFFDNGNMINPMNDNENCKFQAKYECAKKNKVIFITKNEIKYYINYVKRIYNIDFLLSFRNMNTPVYRTTKYVKSTIYDINKTSNYTIASDTVTPYNE